MSTMLVRRAMKPARCLAALTAVGYETCPWLFSAQPEQARSDEPKAQFAGVPKQSSRGASVPGG